MIVGWSAALRGQVINESLGQLPKKLAAGPRVLARTESSRTQSGTKQGGPPHDHWAKLGQLRYTRSQYSFVAIALFSMKFIASPSTKKELTPERGAPNPGTSAELAMCPSATAPTRAISAGELWPRTTSQLHRYLPRARIFEFGSYYEKAIVRLIGIPALSNGTASIRIRQTFQSTDQTPFAGSNPVTPASGLVEHIPARYFRSATGRPRDLTISLK